MAIPRVVTHSDKECGRRREGQSTRKALACSVFLTGNIPIKPGLEPGRFIFVPFSSSETMGEEGARIKRAEDGWHLYVMGCLNTWVTSE